MIFETQIFPATKCTKPAVINWPTRSIGAAKHVRWKRWLAQTLRFVGPPSGQHAREFQMGFEPQLEGRLVYKDVVSIDEAHVNECGKVFSAQWRDSKGVINFCGGWVVDCVKVIKFKS